MLAFPGTVLNKRLTFWRNHNGPSTMLHAAAVAVLAATCVSATSAAPDPPRGWAAVADGASLSESSAESLQMSLALSLSLSPATLRALEQTFEQVSDPRHARYGQHLSAPELEALLLDGHLRSCQQTVAAWLSSSELASGGSVDNIGADAVHITARHADVERVFEVALRAYRRDADGAIAFRAAEPSALLQLPPAVRRCVDVASGLMASELSAVPKQVPHFPLISLLLG